MKSPSEIVDLMFNNDAYSQWLGIERVKDSLGGSHLKMQIRKEMCNGLDVAHGGISFAFADSAFAFACNSLGVKSVSIETSISHVAPLYEGDWIEAIATKKHSSRKIGVYDVEVRKLGGGVVALFKGTCYNTSKEW